VNSLGSFALASWQKQISNKVRMKMGVRVICCLLYYWLNGAALDLPGSFIARSWSERWLVAHFNSIAFAKIAVLAKGSEVFNLCFAAF
jgi:hypothetical protein